MRIVRVTKKEWPARLLSSSQSYAHGHGYKCRFDAITSFARHAATVVVEDAGVIRRCADLNYRIQELLFVHMKRDRNF